MSPILILINGRLGRHILGRYHGDHIELSRGPRTKTLVHELAHYLHAYRFQHRFPGYYRVRTFPLSSNPTKEYYFRTASHGKQFKKCLKDMAGE